MERITSIAQHLDQQLLLRRQQAAQKKTYQYTLDNSILTPAQRDFYEDNGYIVIPKLVSQARIDSYAKHFKEICENPKVRPASMTVMRDVALAKAGVNINSEMVITKVQDFMDYPGLMDYCHDPDVLKYVEAWTGPRIVASHTMVRCFVCVDESIRFDQFARLLYYAYRSSSTSQRIRARARHAILFTKITCTFRSALSTWWSPHGLPWSALPGKTAA